MNDAMLALLTGEARLTIARRGAEAIAWSVGGVDLLWPGDAAIWSQISPILYPVVGWTRDGARVGGQRYPLGLHGFAAGENFAIETARGDFARLTLRDSERTRALYPFAFLLAVEYRLAGPTLEITLEVANPGDAPAPYACGLHPGFRWPFAGGPRAGAFVQFDQEEPPFAPVIAPGGLIGLDKREIPLHDKVLSLDDELFAHDALCFLEPASRSLRFEQADGSAIAMDFSGFGMAGLWTRPGAPFLCLEAWTGHSDPEGFDGDLMQKPAMRILSPGEKARHRAVYAYFAA